MQSGAQLGVDVGVLVGLGVEVSRGVGVRVGVGEPSALFVKIISVTPLPTRTVTAPCETFLSTARSGLTSIRET